MVMQLRRLGVYPAHEMILAAVEEHHQFGQVFALLRHAQGMDHRLLVFIALAQPKPVDRDRQLGFLALHIARFQARKCREHLGGDRREQGHRDDADDHCNSERRQQEIPGRDAGSAGRHQFARPRQLDEGEDPAQQDGEGQHLLAQVGQLQDRHANGRRARHIVAGGTVQQVHNVYGKGQHQEDGIDNRHPDQELDGEITIKRPGPAHAACTFQRARRALGL